MGRIVGGAGVTPMLIPDWNQTNPRRADYIKNKPDIEGIVNKTLEGRRAEIDSTFANNSWDLIKWVCQHDDPSKYWKVGDWKLLDYPEVVRPGRIKNESKSADLYFMITHGTPPTTSKLGKLYIDNPTKFANVVNDNVQNKYAGDTYYYRIFSLPEDNVNNTIPVFCLGIAKTHNMPQAEEKYIKYETFEALLEALGMRFEIDKTNGKYFTNDYIKTHGIHSFAASDYTWKYEAGKVYPAKQYPVMILGFNHDNVTDITSYGKQRAGMTLSLGITRGANNLDKVCPPHYWRNSLPNLYESGVSQFRSAQSDDTLLGPYHKGDGINWKDSEFRETLQHLLDGTELDDKIVAVDKITAEGKHRADRNYFSRDFSSDKISLLSEFETHGMVKHSCAQEGEWYDFFKRGNSRFFWDSRMCGKEEKLTILEDTGELNVADLTLIDWIKEKGYDDVRISCVFNPYEDWSTYFQVNVYEKNPNTNDYDVKIDSYEYGVGEVAMPPFADGYSMSEINFDVIYQKGVLPEASQLILWSRSPRGDSKVTDPLTSSYTCALYCADVMAIEEGSVISDDGVSIVDEAALISYIKNLEYAERNYYGDYRLAAERHDVPDDEGYYDLILYKNEAVYKTLYTKLHGNDIERWDSILSSMGLSGMNECDPPYTRVISFTIGHGKQVDYKPDVWGNSGYGTLLPIFCL